MTTHKDPGKVRWPTRAKPIRKNHADANQLENVFDTDPGIRRRRAGRGFVYLDTDGRLIHDRDTLRRIKALAIPPAWTEVWICPIENGHIQAIGRDAKGRKQYRYHALWNEHRSSEKFSHILRFGEALPTIHERLEADLALRGLPREKVLALIVRLLEETLIRVGNMEYTRANQSFGLTTLRDNHVAVTPSTLRFCFRGKSGIEHQITINDRRLARLVKRCRDIPGKELFQYIDETGARHHITSTDVNNYLREISGEDFTAKDFRTWGGSMLAVQLLQGYEIASTKTQRQHHIREMIKAVASHLGNTTAVCRKYYVHPLIIDSYLAGSFLDLFPKANTEHFEEQLISALRKVANPNR